MEWLYTKLGSAYGSVAGWFVGLGHKMWNGIKTGWDASVQTAGSWWGSFVAMLSNSWTTTKQWFVNVGLSIGRVIATGWNQSKTTDIHSMDFYMDIY